MADRQAEDDDVPMENVVVDETSPTLSSALIRLQCIYNLWSIHAMLTTILYGFGMISMELTQTDAVFSKTTVVLFFVQKWRFSKWAETFWWFFFVTKETPEASWKDQKVKE